MLTLTLLLRMEDVSHIARPQASIEFEHVHRCDAKLSTGATNCPLVRHAQFYLFFSFTPIIMKFNTLKASI